MLFLLGFIIILNHSYHFVFVDEQFVSEKRGHYKEKTVPSKGFSYFILRLLKSLILTAPCKSKTGLCPLKDTV